MLWEIADDIKKYVKMTLIPSMRNLFSSIRSLVGMFLVMLILQMLLSVICIFGIENIKNQQTVLNDFKVTIASHSSIIEENQGSFLTSDTFVTALSSTSIFIGALIIWAICAITVYQKVTFSSADRDKYLWGMYTTHGAKKRKIRSMLKAELYVPHLAATVVAYPLSLAICNLALRDHGYSYGHSAITLVAILLLSYVCIRLVVEYQCFLIRSISCIDMLREEDAPKSICYPRKISRLTKGFKPCRYGTSTFLRMRKYYVSLALIAAIPAVIWVCFHVSATSQDSYLSSEIKEFTIKFHSGISEEQMKSIKEDELSTIDGISSVTSSAYYDASKIYSHVLLDNSHYSTIVNSPYFTTSYADNSMLVGCADRALKQYIGYSMSAVNEGTVNIIAPASDTKYNFTEGDRIFFAVSKIDGNVRAVNSDSVSLLRQELDDEYEYVELKVGNIDNMQHSSLTKDGFLNVNDTYFLLNSDDYEKITSMSVDNYTTYVIDEFYSYSNTLDNKAHFNITVPLSKFDIVPKAGDCVEAKGKYSLTVSLTDGNRTWNKQLTDRSFNYAYINSVSINGETVTLNVTPYDIIELEETVGITVSEPILALGTPEVESKEDQYFASTCDDLTLTDGTVTLVKGIITVYSSSVVTAAEVGTHAMLSDGQFSDELGKIRLEELHADNGFDIMCGDKTTLDSFNLDIPVINNGNAALILPTSAANYWVFEQGDKLRIATVQGDVVDYDPDSMTLGGSYDLLAQHIKQNQYDYVVVHIDKVIYSDDAERPCVILSSDDFSDVINKRAPYTSFTICVDSGIESKQYAEIREQINYWVANETYMTSVSSTGNYLEYLLRKNANYETIMMLISTIVPLMIPFIWYYPMATLFDRRKTEIRVLEAIGKKRRTIRACFFFEGALTSLSAFLAVILLCRPAMFIFRTVCKLCKLPLEFEYEFLSLPVLLSAGIFSAVCASVCFGVCYATTSAGRIKKSARRKNGNS